VERQERPKKVSDGGVVSQWLMVLRGLGCCGTKDASGTSGSMTLSVACQEVPKISRTVLHCVPLSQPYWKLTKSSTAPTMD